MKERGNPVTRIDRGIPYSWTDPVFFFWSVGFTKHYRLCCFFFVAPSSRSNTWKRPPCMNADHFGKGKLWVFHILYINLPQGTTFIHILWSFMICLGYHILFCAPEIIVCHEFAISLTANHIKRWNWLREQCSAQAQRARRDLFGVTAAGNLLCRDRVSFLSCDVWFSYNGAQQILQKYNVVWESNGGRGVFILGNTMKNHYYHLVFRQHVFAFRDLKVTKEWLSTGRRRRKLCPLLLPGWRPFVAAVQPATPGYWMFFAHFNEED